MQLQLTSIQRSWLILVFILYKMFTNISMTNSNTQKQGSEVLSGLK